MNKALYGLRGPRKAFDRVPRKVIWLALRKLGVVEWIVPLVQEMYAIARSRFHVCKGFSKEFEVNNGVHRVLQDAISCVL